MAYCVVTSVGTAFWVRSRWAEWMQQGTRRLDGALKAMKLKKPPPPPAATPPPSYHQDAESLASFASAVYDVIELAPPTPTPTPPPPPVPIIGSYYCVIS
jgi:hypothetical protein